MNDRRTTHLLMLLLIVIWSIDAVTVSLAVSDMSQIFLLCFKTMCSIPVIALYTRAAEGLRLPRRKDVPLLLLATVLGDILYFYFEYTAYRYLPVSMVTLALGMLPAASHLTDCALAHRRPTAAIMVPILISIGGLALAVVPDASEGNALGYLSCALCVALWIAYGYVARRLGERRYGPAQITLYESVAASLIMLPFALLNAPASLTAFDVGIGIVVMGVVTTGFGYMLEVRGLIVLGTTVSGLYLNILPVFTAIAGIVFLREPMTALQWLGAAIVIVSSVFVIRETEKGKT